VRRGRVAKRRVEGGAARFLVAERHTLLIERPGSCVARRFQSKERLVLLNATPDQVAKLRVGLDERRVPVGERRSRVAQVARDLVERALQAATRSVLLAVHQFQVGKGRVLFSMCLDPFAEPRF
jgi:hypothetical protein